MASSSGAPNPMVDVSMLGTAGALFAVGLAVSAVGMLVAYVVNPIFSASDNWRAMFWVGAVSAVLLVVVATRRPTGKDER